jgi:thioredoxin-related protein
MKTVAAILIIFTFVSPEWLNDFDAAKQLATNDHKQILLNFSGSDWCAPCIKMKKEVFESEKFLSLAGGHLVLLRADFPRNKKNKLSEEQTKKNEMLAERYNPNGHFPLTVLLDANGKIVKEWDGYVFSSQDKFITDLTAALSK